MGELIVAWFLDIYRGLEKSIFNTLTRKLIGNFSFLIALQVIFCLILWSCLTHLQSLVADGTQGVELLKGVQTCADSMQMYVLVFGLLFFFGMLGALLFLRHLVVRPVRQMNRQLAKMATEDADLSQPLNVGSIDEFSELAHNYNQFIARLRDTVGTVRQMGIGIAVNSAKVLNRIGYSATQAAKQGDLSELIFSSSDSVTQSIHAISDNAQTIAGSTADCLESAHKSYQSLETLTQDIGNMQGQIEEHDSTIKKMGERSRDIAKIIKTIQEISFQTGLLSLNAAVEAARAGEAGRGFSVVAGEVKKLAEQASKSSEDIATQLHAVLSMIESATAEAGKISRFANQTSEVAETSCHSFKGLIREFEQNNQRLSEITSSVEGVSQANAVMHQNVTEIRHLGHDVGEQMEHSNEVAKDLKDNTEQLQQLVAYFKTGSGVFEKILEVAREFQQRTKEVVEEISRQGINVFDTNYQPIPGTEPQKYRTAYDSQFDRAMQQFIDQIAEKAPGGTFAVAVDVNGYLPTHNSKFSKPLTGDPAVDLVGSRQKRIFNDPTGIRSARNREPFLLQTYMRDTGEILSDLSMPVMIGDRHWGGIRIGLNPNVMLES